MKISMNACPQAGVTLIELLIVVTIIGILLALSVPGYSNHMMRVNRGEAIRQLMQAAMCQERIRARHGSYDTGECITDTSQQYYRISYQPPDTRGLTYAVIATPVGAQLQEPCGKLILNQDGGKRIGSRDANATKCWNGR